MSKPPDDIRRCRDFRYRLLEHVDRHLARVEVEGMFEQRPVRWLATIVALSHERSDEDSACPRPFIEIDPSGPAEDGTIVARIGLPVAAIDAATICKTIIMLRKYKRLRRGRMAFGDAGN